MVKRGKSYSAKKIAVCAMLAALGVVMLTLGAFIEVIDISMAVIASLLGVIAVIEYGGGAPWMVYGVTAILSLLLMPATPAVFYTAFFGFYPILKEKFERRPRMIAWVLKEIVFNISLALMGVASVYLIIGKNSALLNPIYIGVAVILAEAVFILYDIALTRLITFYIVALRRRFKF